jgi:hypothetical protein
MATVKILYYKDPEKLLRYLMQDEKVGEISSELTTPDSFVKEVENASIKTGREKSNNKVIHIIQSWDKDTSQNYSLKDFNQAGSELVKKKFPNHQFVVITHKDTDHKHNHIVINPVSIDLEKRISNRMKHLHDLRELNDGICKERGMPVIDKDLKKYKNKTYDLKKFKYLKFEAFKEEVSFSFELATNKEDFFKLTDSFKIEKKIKNDELYLKPYDSKKFYSVRTLEKRLKIESFEKIMNVKKWQSFYKDHLTKSPEHSKKIISEVLKINSTNVKEFVEKTSINESRKLNEIRVKNLGKLINKHDRLYSKDHDYYPNPLTLKSISSGFSLHNSLISVKPNVKDLYSESLEKDQLTHINFNKKGMDYGLNLLKKIENNTYYSIKNYQYLTQKGFVFKGIRANEVGIFDKFSNENDIVIRSNSKNDLKFILKKPTLEVNKAKNPLNNGRTINLYPYSKVFNQLDMSILEKSEFNFTLSNKKTKNPGVLDLEVDKSLTDLIEKIKKRKREFILDGQFLLLLKNHKQNKKEMDLWNRL